MDFLNQLFELFVIPAMGILAGFLVWLIKYKIEEIKQQISNGTAQKYLTMAENAIVTSVIMVNQVYVQSLKEQGKFDAAAQKIAFQKAKDTALEIMGKEAQKFLQESLDDFDLWLKAQIEATVNVNK